MGFITKTEGMQMSLNSIGFGIAYIITSCWLQTIRCIASFFWTALLSPDCLLLLFCSDLSYMLSY